MNRFIKSAFISVVLCLFFSLNLSASETVRLTNGEWEPLMSKKLKHYGILSHIASEAFSAVGVRVEYGFFPWKRSLFLAERGDWDGTVGWVFSAEREKSFHFSEPVHDSETVFFHLKNTIFDWKSEDDLQGIIIGVMRGIILEDRLREMKEDGKKMVYESVTDDLQNFKKLEKGRVQLVLVNKEIGLTVIKEKFTPEAAEKFIYHPKPFALKKLHVIFSRKNEKGRLYVELFNRGFNRLKENGRLEQMWEDFRQGKYKK